MEASAALPDDLLVEILSRLPAKSVHRFKCVSKLWRDLISDRNHRKRLPQTLAGFFYTSWDVDRFPTEARHFTNLSGRGPPLVKPTLAFLPNHADIGFLDCCNGLLLCGHETYHSPEGCDFFVCNPATEKWVALPDPGYLEIRWTCHLAFDSAVSSHFHVFLCMETDGVGQVRIYSSRTGRWNHIVRDLSLDGWVSLFKPKGTVFFNGLLHFLTYQGVVMAVDLEAKEWKKIELPNAGEPHSFLGQSQGCLWYVGMDDDEDQFSFWTLEDGAWSLKHSVSTMQLFGGDFYPNYQSIAFHPDCNIMFFMGGKNMLMSYDIDRGKTHRLVPLEPEWLQTFLPCPITSGGNGAVHHQLGLLLEKSVICVEKNNEKFLHLLAIAVAAALLRRYNRFPPGSQ